MAIHSFFGPYLRLLPLLLALANFLPSARADTGVIECLVPHAMGDGVRPTYKTGEQRQFQWKSTWPEFNLSIVQVNTETGAKTYDRVFENEPSTTANYFWTAKNNAGLSQDDPFHLWIVNAANGDCDTCHCRSANFTVLDASVASNSSDDSTPSATAPAASQTLSEGSSGTDEHLKLGLGLGLGLGIPLLIILTALATWLCVRRRRRQRQGNLTAGAYDEHSLHHPPSASIPLASAGGYNHMPVAYSSEPSEKSPGPEIDGQHVAEMQTDNTRVEAPSDAGVTAELEGDVMARKVGDVKMV